MGKCQSKTNNNKKPPKQQSEQPLPNNNDNSNNITVDNVNNEDANVSEHNQPTVLNIEFTFVENGEIKHVVSLSTLNIIQSIFDEIKQKVNKYAEYDIVMSNNQSLLSCLNDKIYKVFPNESEHELTLLYLGLNIADNVIKAYETNISIIATPLLDIGDKIALVYYNKFTQQVSHCVLDNESLSIFTHISAYCNGNNMLFISGGETTSSNYHNAFYAIDLFNSDKTEQLPNLNEARGWHSMLYVPNSFVFIVGGTSKAVEVYDIDKGTIVCDSEINELRRETTLCLVNNALLYCFGGFVFEDECFSTTVERCNLRESKRKWVYVNYIQNDNSFFDECYYLASYYTNDAIVLFKVVESDSGNESECGGIVFDFENEDKPIINSFNNTDVVTGIFNEKFVIPIANNCKVVFPMITDKVVLYTCESNCQIKEKVYSNILNELL
jgi:hypothetical protein